LEEIEMVIAKDSTSASSIDSSYWQRLVLQPHAHADDRRERVVFALVLAGLFVAGAILIARERFANPVLGLGVKLGIVMAMIGIGLGGLMTAPTPAQLAVLQSGGQLDYLGAHNVGAFVDGQTRMLPILGWNMDGGDLRIPHFVGIHDAQFIPFVAAMALVLGARGLSVNRQRVLVWVGAAFYFGLTMLVMGQALRNESIVAPSAQALGVAAGLAALSMAAMLLTVGPPARRPRKLL